MFKKLIKDTKGEFAVMAVIIMPIIIGFVFTIIFTNMKTNVYYKQTQSALDNALYYAAQQFGDIKTDKSGEKYCDFNYDVLNGANENSSLVVGGKDYSVEGADKTKLLYNFDNYIRKTDGYNSLWFYELSIDSNKDYKFDAAKNINNEYITAKITMIIPSKDSAEGMMGTAIGNDDTLWTGWYQTHKELWKDLIRRYSELTEIRSDGTVIFKDENGNELNLSEDNVDNFLKKHTKELIVKTIEVSASCY